MDGRGHRGVGHGVGRRRIVAPAASAFIACILALGTVAPARADFCLQLNGGPFSGDLGFFRFRGKLPTVPGSILALRGRVAGLGPVFGTAILAKDNSYLEIGATFFADSTQGQFDLFFLPPTARTGSGDGDYGAYGTGESFAVTRVGCPSEP